MDFELEIVENGLELMAMNMPTQRTSQNSILESQNLDFGYVVFCMFVYFMCFATPNRVSAILYDQSWTGVGQKDAD